MALAPNAENIRSEIARHRLSREAVGSLINMHVNQVSMFANGIRPLSDWASHNLGWAINTTTGLMIFGVDMERGPVRAPRGRPNRGRRRIGRKGRPAVFVSY